MTILVAWTQQMGHHQLTMTDTNNTATETLNLFTGKIQTAADATIASLADGGRRIFVDAADLEGDPLRELRELGSLVNSEGDTYSFAGQCADGDRWEVELTV